MTGQPVHVFYTPHADDETIGMAGAIAKAKLDGARVVLVLVTDNLPSPRAVDLFSDRKRCHWHQKAKHDLGHINLVQARLLEFRHAASLLGADEVATLGIPEQMGVDDYPRFVEAISVTVQRYETQYPGAIHHVTSAFDAHLDFGSHKSHRALAEAVTAAGVRSVSHRVYIYSVPAVQRIAPVILHLPANVMRAKVAAMAAYKLWKPAEQRIAYGYHSASELFDGAASDPREFLDAAA